MTDQPIEPKPKRRRETKFDREQERIRKRQYREALKEYSEFNRKKISEKLGNIMRIPDAEWEKAAKADEAAADEDNEL